MEQERVFRHSVCADFSKVCNETLLLDALKLYKNDLLQVLDVEHVWGLFSALHASAHFILCMSSTYIIR